MRKNGARNEAMGTCDAFASEKVGRGSNADEDVRHSKPTRFAAKNSEMRKDMSRNPLLMIVATMTMYVSFMAIGQGSSAFAPGWDPSEFQLSTDGPCSFELTEASAALELRDSGKSKEEAAAALPAETGASALIMKSILDDVYENPGVSHFPYFVFRNITCMRRHMGRTTPATLAAVAPQVVACQRQFGAQASDHLISCIQKAVTGGVR